MDNLVKNMQNFSQKILIGFEAIGTEMYTYLQSSENKTKIGLNCNANVFSLIFRCLGTRQLLSEEDECQPNGKIFKVNSFNFRLYCVTTRERGHTTLGAFNEF